MLLSYAKIALSHDLLASPLLEEPQLASWLDTYFPPALREGFSADIKQHSLRREIIATGITNAVVNRCGPAFAVRVADETRRSTADVSKAFLAVRDIYDLPKLWQRLDDLEVIGLGDRLERTAEHRERHGGRVWVGDVPGGGACVGFALPVLNQSR